MTARRCFAPAIAPVFRAGEANGHAIENRSDEPAVLFEIGSRSADETVHYPDVDLRLERRNNARNWIRTDGTPKVRGGYPTLRSAIQPALCSLNISTEIATSPASSP